jgi:cell division protein FtsL
MKGLKLRTIVGLFCLVLCAAGVLVAHVWKQNAYVRLSMATVKIGKVRTQLQNDIALLEISVGGLKKLSRIEGMAKGRFGLEYGNTPVLVYLESHAGEGETEAGSASVSVSEKVPGAVAEAGTEAKGLEAGKVAWRIKGF